MARANHTGANRRYYLRWSIRAGAGARRALFSGSLPHVRAWRGEYIPSRGQWASSIRGHLTRCGFVQLANPDNHAPVEHSQSLRNAAPRGLLRSYQQVATSRYPKSLLVLAHGPGERAATRNLLPTDISAYWMPRAAPRQGLPAKLQADMRTATTNGSPRLRFVPKLNSRISAPNTPSGLPEGRP